jgi:hypothetical protein
MHAGLATEGLRTFREVRVASPCHVPICPNFAVTSVLLGFIQFNRLVESITCRRHLTVAGTLVIRTFILRAVS